MNSAHHKAISAAYLASLINILDDMGMPRAQSLGACGACEADLTDLKYRLALPGLNALFDAARGHLGIESIGFELGARFRVNTFTQSGNVLAMAPTIARAVELNSHYSALTETVGQSSLSRRASGDFMIWDAGSGDQNEFRDAAELICTGYATTTHWLAWSFNGGLVRAGFRHDAPADTRRHEAVFGCPVEFGCAENFVQFSDGLIDLPLPSSAPGSLAQTTAKLDVILAGLERERTLKCRVTFEITKAVKTGALSEAAIARSLGYSGRSLRRALQGQGLTYRAVVDDVMKTLTLNYMRSGRSLTEISVILGYNDPPAFTRAFKRWFGMTPTAYKKQHRI